MRQLKFRMNFKIRKLQKQYVSSVIAQVVIIKCNVHNCKYSSHFTCRLQHQQTAGKSRESYQPLATDCLPKATKDFFDMQIAMGRVAKHGQRYKTSEKDLAVQLFHHSPRCYSELQRVFKLPSKTTLRRHVMGSLGGFDVS